MGPLSRVTGAPIESDSRLLEGAHGDDALSLIEELMDEVAVLCSHGDVIPAFVDLLRFRGVPVAGRGCEKGSIWRLDGKPNDITGATYLGRPN